MKKFKNSVALMMAVLMISVDMISADLVSGAQNDEIPAAMEPVEENTVTAEPEPAVTASPLPEHPKTSVKLVIDQLPLVDGTGLGQTAVLKIKAADNGGHKAEAGEIVLNLNDDGSVKDKGKLELCTKCKYTYELSSENYMPVLGKIKVDPVERTAVISIDEGKMLPDYKLEAAPVISGSTALVYGDVETYSLQMNQNWIKHLTWEIVSSSSGDLISADGENHTYNVTAGGEGTFKLAAKLKGVPVSELDVQVSKKDTALTVNLDKENSPWDKKFTVHAFLKDADGPLKNMALDIAVTKGLLTAASDTVTTDEFGGVSWSYDSLLTAGEYKVTVVYNSDNTFYKSSDKIEKTYTAAKAERKLTDSIEVDYGTADAVINLNDQLKNYKQNGVVLKSTDILGEPAALSVEGACARVSINKEDGTIIVKNMKAGKEKLVISFETADYMFEDTIDITVNKYPLQIIRSDVHTGMKNGTAFDGSKVYDGTKEISVSVVLDDAGLNRLTEEKKKEITNKNLIFASCDSGIRNVKGEEKVQDITVQLSLENSDFSDKENYYLANGSDVPAQLKILKKELTLNVSDNSRSYRSEKYGTPLTDDGMVKASGFIDGEKENIEQNRRYKLPLVVDSTLTGIDNVFDDTAELGVIPDVLLLDETTGDPTGNYKFDFVNYHKGALQITEEEAGREYINIDNHLSVNVFQINEGSDVPAETIYFGNGKTEGEDAAAKFLFTPESGYNVVYVDGAEVPAETGLKLKPSVPGDSETITKEAYLCTVKDGRVIHKTKTFKISFIYDHEVPECTSISFGTADHVISDLASAITFGLYSKTAVEASVDIKDAASGLKNWSYCVVDVDQDKTYQDIDLSSKDELKNYLAYKPFAKPEDNKNTIVIGALHKGESLTDRNNFVVYVRAEDQVGNARIYGSNGIVLEDYHNITIGFNENSLAAAVSDGSRNHYNDSVELEVLADETGDEKCFSGLKQIDYSVMINGSEENPPEPSVYQQDAVNNGTIKPEEWIPADVTLEQLRQYCKLNTKKYFKVSTAESKKIDITASATDYAGNTMELPSTCSFVVDGVKPAVTSGIFQRDNGGKFRNGKYADSNVIYEAAITERYLDQVRVHINDTVYTLEQLAAAAHSLGIILKKDPYPDHSSTTDQSEYKFTMEFTKDGNYDVFTSASDIAGNSAEDAHNVFTIDTVRPRIKTAYKVRYYNGAEKILNAPLSERVYANEEVKSIEIIPKIIEANFALSGTKIDSASAAHVNDKDAAAVSGWSEKFASSYNNAANWESIGYADGVRKIWINRNINDIVLDAEYTFKYTYTDLAGNQADMVEDHITYDTTRPAGSISVDNMVSGESKMEWINTLVSSITFGLFGRKNVSAEMTCDDITSGVASQQYLLTDRIMNRAQLIQASGWEDYSGKLKIDADQNVVIYEKVVDDAGNIQCFSSDGIITDNKIDAPSITIIPSVPSWGKDVYQTADHPGFDIEAADPVVGDAYSGLHKIVYTITNEINKDSVTETVIFEKEDHKQKWSAHVNIDPYRFYSNRVKVTAKVNDWSQNESEVTKTELKIDSAAPVVNFYFDRSDAKNGKYFSNTKTLVITVSERNFDPSYVPKVTSDHPDGYSFSGWSSNGETHTASVTFTGDGDYAVSYECCDLAGNKSNTVFSDQITIDKSRPEMTVSYDNNNVSNGKYFKDSRTAAITIVEHNFDASKVSIQSSAVTGEAPSVSGWSSNGDRHTAFVIFDLDGEYTLSVSCADLAENAAVSYGQDRFIIDKSRPEVIIEGVENKKAYNGTIGPVIKVTDTNFSADKVSVSLKGINRGDMDLDSLLTTAAAANGRIYSIQNLPEGMDDIYTLTITSADLAGNEENTAVVFSVNRDGSTYVFNDNTKELIDRKFVSSASDISLEEINVNTLEFIEITYSKDGRVVTLKEGTDFVVTVEGEEDGWKKYAYNISSACFEEEGTYVINIYSEDGAGNTTTNKAKAKTIEFTVDKTAPSMVVSNLADGGRYKEDVHQFTINVKDNIAVDSLELYMNDHLEHRYNADELVKKDGLIKVDLKSRNGYQKAALIAKDLAGNETKDAYVSDLVGEDKNAPAVFHVLVTANTWIQFYMNKPLLISSIMILLLLLLSAAYIFKRKHDKQVET